MTWRQKTVIRILLIVAMILAEDAELRRDIHQLSNHISVYREEK